MTISHTADMFKRYLVTDFFYNNNSNNNNNNNADNF